MTLVLELLDVVFSGWSACILHGMRRRTFFARVLHTRLHRLGGLGLGCGRTWDLIAVRMAHGLDGMGPLSTIPSVFWADTYRPRCEHGQHWCLATARLVVP